jgi:hypothetical protein
MAARHTGAKCARNLSKNRDFWTFFVLALERYLRFCWNCSQRFLSIPAIVLCNACYSRIFFDVSTQRWLGWNLAKIAKNRDFWTFFVLALERYLRFGWNCAERFLSILAIVLCNPCYPRNFFDVATQRWLGWNWAKIAKNRDFWSFFVLALERYLRFCWNCAQRFLSILAIVLCYAGYPRNFFDVATKRWLGWNWAKIGKNRDFWTFLVLALEKYIWFFSNCA